ncbi:MAG: transcriptional regulator [Lactococcus plantarum]|nr:transcriptional regulator [Lactococcus plantarum]MDN6070487.1 transcriptional regulator [Lactococcus plantarum]MDN6084554.1 transcriptional regulator [Lactococcus plantarum]
MKKSDRIKLIKKILVDNDIMTQDDLVTALLDLKVAVTQATVSRDMRELRLIKAPAKNGGYRYALPETYLPNSDEDLFKSVVEGVKIQGNQLAIKTSPGSAMILKKRLLSQFEASIFTVLSDDDTILLIALSDAYAKHIYDQLSI